MVTKTLVVTDEPLTLTLREIFADLTGFLKMVVGAKKGAACSSRHEVAGADSFVVRNKRKSPLLLRRRRANDEPRDRPQGTEQPYRKAF